MPDASASAFAWVGIGACLGGMVRYGASLLLAPSASGFPWPTFAVNAVGSLLAGIALAVFTRAPSPLMWHPLLVVGFLGGLTTFSAFSAESLTMLQQGRWAQMATYAIGSLAVGVLAAGIGFWATNRLLPA